MNHHKFPPDFLHTYKWMNSSGFGHGMIVGGGNDRWVKADTKDAFTRLNSD